MNKYIDILLSLIMSAVLLPACGSEGGLEPSNDDIDWYAVEDGTDAIQNLRYEIYLEYGTNVLYTDTIGSRTRKNLEGKEVVEYKKVDIAYWITYRESSVPAYILNEKYFEQGDTAEIETGLKFTQDYVLPLLPRKLIPLSFMLCDTIKMSHSDVRGQHILNTYYSMNTTLVSRLPEISTMSERGKRHHAGRVAGAIYGWHIANKYTLAFSDFTDLANYDNAGNIVSRYGRAIGYSGNYGNTFLGKDNWLNYGFLRYNTSYLTYLTMIGGQVNMDMGTIDTNLAGYTCPNMQQDLMEFIALVLMDDDDWVYETYAGYALILEKYETMKTLLATVNFE